MRVDEIMTDLVITVAPRTPVHDVARLILDNKISGVPVVRANGEIAGIVTDADLIVRSADVRFPSYLQILDNVFFLGDGHRYQEEVRRVLGTTAEEIMTAEVITVAAEVEISEVARIMFEKRHSLIPVIRDKRLVGVISRTDIIRELLREMESA